MLAGGDVSKQRRSEHRGRVAVRVEGYPVKRLQVVCGYRAQVWQLQWRREQRRADSCGEALLGAVEQRFRIWQCGCSGGWERDFACRKRESSGGEKRAALAEYY